MSFWMNWAQTPDNVVRYPLAAFLGAWMLSAILKGLGKGLPDDAILTWLMPDQ